jgi:hypothetical protein
MLNILKISKNKYFLFIKINFIYIKQKGNIDKSEQYL